MLQIDVLTLFPRMFEGVLGESIIKRAQGKKLVKINIYNLRDWSKDKHKKVDDKPYGGGPGMILSCQPIFDAVKELAKRSKVKGQRFPPSCDGTSADPPKLGRAKAEKVILLSPQGKRFDQKLANRLAKQRNLILICGHYEGVDERIKKIVTDEISMGDYVLTGGEIAAMAIIDAVIRLVPGVLGNKESMACESFQNDMLEYPQYTRPRVYKELKVPEVLLTGDHKRIEEWRRKEAIKATRKRFR